MKTVKQVSELSKVSVRTLRYYDSIGLLKPTERTESGYRLYDDNAIARLQTILFFRELEFSLEEIKMMLADEAFDTALAIRQQIELLTIKKEHLQGLIDLAERRLKEGTDHMDFSAFDNSRLEQYKQEAKEKWGQTQAYREYEARGESTSGDDGFMRHFTTFGSLKTLAVEAEAVGQAVKALQDRITKHYYTCTDTILLSLAEMYVQDERFRCSIDAAGGEGTAEFVNKAIKYWCK